MVTAAVAAEALDLLEVDSAGLDRHDRTILETIAVKFAGGPVGLSTLAAAVDEEQDTIEDVYEPYLLQQGLIKRTPRGRVITERGFEHLGLPVPDGAGEPLLSAGAHASASSRLIDASLGLRRAVLHLPELREPGALRRAHGGLSPRPKGAPSAAPASCSSCSTTTTRRPTPPSSSATRRPACSTSAATASSSPGSRTSR